MSHYKTRPSVYDRPILLSAEHMENPEAYLSDFFSDFRLSDLRQSLDDIEETCLGSDGHPFADSRHRSDLINFRRKLELLLEAAFLLARGGRKREVA